MRFGELDLRNDNYVVKGKRKDEAINRKLKEFVQLHE